METLSLSHNEFFVKGPDVSYDIETWYCCRPWPIVISVTTYNPYTNTWKKEVQFVRRCGYCGRQPVPRSTTEG